MIHTVDFLIWRVDRCITACATLLAKRNRSGDIPSSVNELPIEQGNMMILKHKKSHQSLAALNSVYNTIF